MQDNSETVLSGFSKEEGVALLTLNFSCIHIQKVQVGAVSCLRSATDYSWPDKWLSFCSTSRGEQAWGRVQSEGN